MQVVTISEPYWTPMTAIGLRCSECRESASIDRASTLCTACRRPYFVEYDLDAVRAAWLSPASRERQRGMWGYRGLLPLPAGRAPVTLGETETPVIKATDLGRALGLDGPLWIKD